VLSVKTNILIFEKGDSTEKIWYYDLSWIKVGKRNPFTLNRFDDFFAKFDEKTDSEYSWTVERTTIEANNFDIKAVTPNKKQEVDARSSADILTKFKICIRTLPLNWQNCKAKYRKQAW